MIIRCRSKSHSFSIRTKVNWNAVFSPHYLLGYNIDFFFDHKLAGELFPIDQFNLTNNQVEIDQWRIIAKWRVFLESKWLSKMYLARDLAATSKMPPERQHNSFV